MSGNYGVRRNPPPTAGASRLPRNEGVPGSNPGVGLGFSPLVTRRFLVLTPRAAKARCRPMEALWKPAGAAYVALASQ